MTLKELKARPINPRTKELMERTWELSEWNILAYRNRMANPEGISSNVYSITHNGNDPKSNSQMLDDARMYIQKGVYTDEQWEQYFIPAINEMLAYNDNFVRWYTGYVVRNKESNELSIVEYDYGEAFGGRNYTSLSLCTLGENEEIRYCWAWANYKDYELVDSEHTMENIAKLKKYHKGHTPPYCMCSEMSQMLYGQESTMPPMRN